MAIDSLSSKFGLAIQSDKDTANTTVTDYLWFLATTLTGGPQPRQQPLTAEIGGGLLPRDMLKLGVSAAAALEFNPRPNTLGLMLYGILGQVATTQLTPDADRFYTDTATGAATWPGTSILNSGKVTGVPTYATVTYTPAAAVGATAPVVTLTGVVDGTPATTDVLTFAAPGTAGAAAQTLRSTKIFSEITGVVVTAGGENGDKVDVGPYEGTQHVFTIDASNPASIPYMTMMKRTGSSFWERGTGMRMAALALSQNTLNWVTAQAALNGIVPSLISDSDIATQTFDVAANVLEDSGPVFVSPEASFQLNSSFKTSDDSLVARSVNVVLSADADPNRLFRIGSYYPQDITVLARSAAITAEVMVTDRDLYTTLLYDRAYTGSAAGATWDPKVFNTEAGELSTVFKTSTLIDGAVDTVTSDAEDKAYSLTVAARKSVWATSPVALRGNDVVVIGIQGMMVQPDSGDALTLTLVNDQASYA